MTIQLTINGQTYNAKSYTESPDGSINGYTVYAVTWTVGRNTYSASGLVKEAEAVYTTGSAPKYAGDGPHIELVPYKDLWE